MKDFVPYFTNQYFNFLIQKDKKAILCIALKNYIPEHQFIDGFKKIGELIKKSDFETLIFDKTKLTVFHQKSMVWYHVEWKKEMLQHGLVNHFKILPKDMLFRESVKIGKQKILQEYPDFKFEKYNIKYIERLEEAL